MASGILLTFLILEFLVLEVTETFLDSLDLALCILLGHRTPTGLCLLVVKFSGCGLFHYRCCLFYARRSLHLFPVIWRVFLRFSADRLMPTISLGSNNSPPFQSIAISGFCFKARRTVTVIGR